MVIRSIQPISIQKYCSVQLLVYGGLARYSYFLVTMIHESVGLYQSPWVAGNPANTYISLTFRIWVNFQHPAQLVGVLMTLIGCKENILTLLNVAKLERSHLLEPSL